MALLDRSFMGLFGPKPLSNKGTAMAFAAGEAAFKRTGVNAALKDAVRQSIRNDKSRKPKV